MDGPPAFPEAFAVGHGSEILKDPGRPPANPLACSECSRGGSRDNRNDVDSVGPNPSLAPHVLFMTSGSCSHAEDIDTA